MEHRHRVLAAAFCAVFVLVGCNKNGPAPTGASEVQPASVGDAAASPATTPAVSVQQLSPAIPEDLRELEVVSSGECGIEATEQYPQGSELRLSRAATTLLEGWSVVRESATAPDSVYFKLDSGSGISYFAPVEMVSRQGLGIRLNDPALDRAGYRVNLGLSHVEPGNYAVQVAERLEGKTHLCATGRSVVVTD